MKFISRATWGAAYAKGSGPIPGPVLGVTCHWEGPHMGDFPHDVCARKVKTIERFHATMKSPPWAGIAYNLLVCPHGYVFEGRGAGVRSAANGDSSIGGNDRWYAVCYLGGVGDPFTDAGKQGMADAIDYLRAHGAGPRVNGHRDHHPTECPGDAIYAWTKQPIGDDDMPLNDADKKWIEDTTERIVAKYVGDVVPAVNPNTGEPTKVTVRTALKRLLERDRPAPK